MNQNTESKLHFFARCREVLRRRHHKPFHGLERPPGVERLEPRLAPAVTGMVSGTTVNLTGDGASDSYNFGVDGSGNLTHTFPTGAGAGMFASADDFDSSQPGVQSAKADTKLSVRITDSGGTDKLDFSGLPSGVSMSARGLFGTAGSANGTFTFGGIESFTGTPQADKLDFTTDAGGSVTIDGGDGNDTITASGAGSAVLDGGKGNDKIDGKTKTGATINGGDGDDTLIGSAGANVIDGGIGNDKIDAGKKTTATVTGGDGNDTITTAADRATIDAGKGNDQVTVKSGKKSVVNVDGGDDADTINGGDAPATLSGGKGDDLIMGGKGDEVLNGNDGNDTLNGGKGNDTLDGDAGVDSLLGAAGRNTLSGEGTGNFNVTTDKFTHDNLAGLVETDTFTGITFVSIMGDNTPNKLDAFAFPGMSSLFGSGGDDILIGSAGGNLLNGGGGDDQLFGGAGKDLYGVNLGVGETAFNLENTIGSGQGTDTIGSIEGAIINVLGPQGTFVDAFLFSGGGVTVNGGGGNDTFADGFGNDVFNGGEGSDLVFLNGGKNKFDGGGGTDAVSGDFSPFGVNISSTGLRGTAKTSFINLQGKTVFQASTIPNFEVFEGSPQNDIFKLTAPRGGGLIADAGDGNDKITGGGRGTLDVFGGDGDDTITLSAAALIDHKASGGKGNDRIKFSGAGGGFGFGEDGDDTVNLGGFGGADGGAGNDLLISGSRGNDLVGGADNDILIGGGGADFLNGGAGADCINAGSGDDNVNTLDGSGTDTADGGSGNDFHTGDAGDTTSNFP